MLHLALSIPPRSELGTSIARFLLLVIYIQLAHADTCVAFLYHAQTASTPFGEQDEHWAKVHLALLLAVDDL